MISQADTLGVFQVESRAQTQMLPRLQPRCFNDLIVAISLIRPGPIQGNMVHPYLRRRLGLEPVTYLHPDLEPALAETLGVILFQEQVLKVARDLAGFSPGQGEQLRRALGAKHAGEAIERFREAFLTGAGARGVPADIAETVFAQLRAFGGYAFAKSHAAAFVVLVYQSAWLKKYHPAAFLVALLNNQPMGFWNPAVLVGDARRHGLPIWPVDIHRSQARCGVEAGGIRLGFNYVAGLGEDASTRLIAAREIGPFQNLSDFCRRTRLPRRIIENLIVIGAMDRWGLPRRKLLWELGQLRYQTEELELVFPDDGLTWPPFSPTEAMTLEYEVLGLLTGDHIMTLYRPRLAKQGILGTQDLAKCANGQRIRLAGLLVVHQAPPTAQGFHFLTLEDEAGLVDVILRPQLVTHVKKLPSWQGYSLNDQTLVLVEGIVQQDGNTTSILASTIRPLRTSASAGSAANSD